VWARSLTVMSVVNYGGMIGLNNARFSLGSVSTLMSVVNYGGVIGLNNARFSLGSVSISRS
jgi:hypothetical protein